MIDDDHDRRGGVIEVRTATPGDREALATALARAFWDDPVMTWLMGRDPVDRLRHFFRAELGQYLRGPNEVLTSPGREGAALWAPPGRWRTGWLDVVRATPSMTLALRLHLPRALRALSTIERVHPREPHWYLAVLGTEPAAQGRGIGAALVEPILERCDQAGLAAYLESSKEQNVPYYQRFGFKVTGEIALPNGPTVWSMWREAAA